MRKRLLIINPPSPDPKYLVIRDVNRSGRMTRERMIWPQTNLAYLAAIIRDRVDVEVIDCIAEKISWGRLQTILRKKRPDFVLSNVISTTLTNDMYLFFLAKQYGAVCIAMGPHVTDLPGKSLLHFPALDYAIVHEPEYTFRELIEALLAGVEDFSEIQGLAWRRGGAPIVNAARPFIENLDALPMPAHELLPLDHYRMPFFGNYTFIIAGRGCPFHCIFCRQNVMWHSHVRMRSGNSLFEETKYLLSLGVKNILYQADTFTANRKTVVDLCKLIIAAGLRFKWACNTHLSTVDEELLQLMKRAGCWMIAPGIESCSQKVLNNIQKKTTVEQIHRVTRMIHDAGIEVWGYFVFGLPGDTVKSLENSIHCALRLPLDMANFAVAAPYPGTPFFEQVTEAGWLRAESWEQFDQNWSAVVEYPELSREQILKAVKRANLRFYARPKPIRKILGECIRDPAMMLSLVHIIWDHLRFLAGKETHA